MKTLSKVSGHWTDEQLIASLYDVGPENGHLSECADCRQRLSLLKANRQALQREAASIDEVDFAFLAAQRRRIYARLEEPVRLWWRLPVRRWVSAAATVVALGSGLVVFEQYRQELAQNKISDAQLALEVSRMSQDLEAQPVAPLQGLFE
jgi:hypothetical protein